MLELYNNSLIPIEDRLEIAKGMIEFYKDSYLNQLSQKCELERELEETKELLTKFTKYAYLGHYRGEKRE
jgi:hypothetical protein